MSVTSSIEHFAAPLPFFDAEEEATIVPSLGYSKPPPGFDEATERGSLLDLDDPDDEMLAAALGDRKRLMVVTLGLFGLALGVLAALLI